MRMYKQDLIGVGLYTVAEAARLTRVPARRIRRWIVGYSYRRAEEIHDVPAVWGTQIPQVDNTVGLGFLDLMEVRFVDAFRRYGVSWTVIRLAAERACELFERNHPFSLQRFKTDGRCIFAEIIEEAGETKLLDLFRHQYAFHRVVSPSLYAGLEFSNRAEAIRWYPMWPKRQVVVDPRRAFGRPIVAREGVPTAILAKMVEVEYSIERAAKWYDVRPQAVRAAVAFERVLAA